MFTLSTLLDIIAIPFEHGEFSRRGRYVMYRLPGIRSIELTKEYGYDIYIGGACVDIADGHDVSDLPMATAVLDNDGAYRIHINRTLRDAPAHIRHAVILHEIGHIVNKDLEDADAAFDGNVLNCEAREIAADAYAKSHGGDIAAALEMLRVAMRASGLRCATYDLTVRLAAL